MSFLSDLVVIGMAFGDIDLTAANLSRKYYEYVPKRRDWTAYDSCNTAVSHNFETGLSAGIEVL